MLRPMALWVALLLAGSAKTQDCSSNEPRRLSTSAHMQATNQMGSTRDASVVSPDFAVWGTQDLYVVDASVFPTSIGANPMQSVYTFAKIFADRVNSGEIR